MKIEHHLFMMGTILLAAILFLTVLTRCSTQQEELRVITKPSYGVSTNFREEAMPVMIDGYNEPE